MTEPVLTIITVCFNARASVRATIDNILRQTWKHFEYLIVDGGSTDGTQELLRQSAPLFAQAGIPFRYRSEPDRGIYDAMNKGTRMADGTWLLFLNAGDLLADELVLEHIFSEPSKARIIYGDTRCIYQGKSRLYPALPLEHLNFEMAFCHQSALIRRELLLKHPYDTSYRVCADHHFFLSMYLSGIPFEYRQLPIAVYEIAGYSDRNKFPAHREQHRMQKEAGIFHFSLSWLLRECRFYLKQGIKAVFGQKLIDKVRRTRLR